MIKAVVCIAGLLMTNCIFAQVFVYKLSKEIEINITKGVDCLKAVADSCDVHFQKALQLAREKETDSLVAMTYFEICTAIDYYGKEEDRLRYAQEGVQLEGAKHPTVTNRLYRELGSSYRRTGTLDSILPAYERAMEWAKFSGDNSTIAITYINWSGGLKRLGNIKKAIEVLLEGEPYAKASGDPHRVNGIVFNLASTYYANKDLVQAILKYDEAAEGFLAIEDSLMYVSALVNRAVVSIEMGERR